MHAGDVRRFLRSTSFQLFDQVLQFLDGSHNALFEDVKFLEGIR